MHPDVRRLLRLAEELRLDPPDATKWAADHPVAWMDVFRDMTRLGARLCGHPNLQQQLLGRGFSPALPPALETLWRLAVACGWEEREERGMLHEGVDDIFFAEPFAMFVKLVRATMDSSMDCMVEALEALSPTLLRLLAWHAGAAAYADSTGRPRVITAHTHAAHASGHLGVGCCAPNAHRTVRRHVQSQARPARGAERAQKPGGC